MHPPFCMLAKEIVGNCPCVVKNDAGILLASLNAQEVVNVLTECPVSILKSTSIGDSGADAQYV